MRLQVSDVVIGLKYECCEVNSLVHKGNGIDGETVGSLRLWMAAWVQSTS